MLRSALTATATLGATLCLGVLGGCGHRHTESTAASASASAAHAATTSAGPSSPSAAASGRPVTGSPSPSSDAGASSAPPEYESEQLPEPDLMPDKLEEQRAAMLRRMVALGVMTAAQQADVEKIISTSKHLGQGNPQITDHPLTRAQCLERRKAAGVHDEKKPRCGAPYMVPLYDPASEHEDAAKVCIDRYEFPGLPCDYPVTWVTTAQAQQLCNAIGKRLCDAHEWEGACAGTLRPAEQEYAFGQPRRAMQGLHNRDRQILWAYGPKKDHKKCATGSRRSKRCTASGWKLCGSNTYPSGSFPECRSSFGVYDQHGNAAEHMALPLKPEQLGSRGGFGEPEMKGSWFIFDSYEAHEDDCRWRAPAWHATEGKNHSNYHLGFRCCKDVKPE